MMQEKNEFAQEERDRWNNYRGTWPPWVYASYKLVSWWDMERFSAKEFYNIGGLLNSLIVGLTDPREKDSLFKEEDRLALETHLRPVEEGCSNIGLMNSAETVSEIRSEILTWTAKELSEITAKQLWGRIDEIDRAIRREMRLHLFMHIPIDRAEYYQPWGESKRAKRGEEVPLFGEAVQSKFPSAEYDVTEAGNCFAAARFTACVFHLMRVLEMGLCALAKKFTVPSDYTNWQNIIEEIEKKIRGMGSDPAKSVSWKEEQEYYSQAASQFIFLKNAWRNSVMHARKNYTEDEAEKIMEHTRAFMQKLADKLSE